MNNQKTGFVFHFDNYPILISLPLEQRGWLITAISVYADRVWRDQSVTAEAVLEQFPQLSAQARVAYQFMTNAILRDTQRWLQQREARIQRRQQAAGAASQESENRRYQEDLERLKRLMGKEPEGPCAQAASPS